MSTHVKSSFKERVRRLHSSLSHSLFFPPALSLIFSVSASHWSAANLAARCMTSSADRRQAVSGSAQAEAGLLSVYAAQPFPPPHLLLSRIHPSSTLVTPIPSSLTAPICESAYDNGPIITEQAAVEMRSAATVLTFRRRREW